jgi:hypothetical protein
MLTIPVPMFGVKGMKKIASAVRNWPEKAGEKKARLYLGNQVRNQEEIDTGGGGFRFIFEAILRESAGILGKPELISISSEVTEVGDRWRDFALMSAKIFKERSAAHQSYDEAAKIIEECARREYEIFQKLRALDFSNVTAS